MRNLKFPFVATVLGLGLVTTINLAAARNLVLTTADCAAPSNPPAQWYTSSYPNYFVPNWEPFFRRHVYVYGPILNCAAVSTEAAIVAPPVISTKY
jgi:hypothetical protein